jgi:hypothetical protein
MNCLWATPPAVNSLSPAGRARACLSSRSRAVDCLSSRSRAVNSLSLWVEHGMPLPLGGIRTLRLGFLKKSHSLEDRAILLFPSSFHEGVCGTCFPPGGGDALGRCILGGQLTSSSGRNDPSMAPRDLLGICCRGGKRLSEAPVTHSTGPRGHGMEDFLRSGSRSVSEHVSGHR